MKSGIKTLAIWLVIGVIVIFVLPAILNNASNKLTYSELLSMVESGSVTDIEIEYEGEGARVKLKDDPNVKTVNIPSVDNLLENLNTSMQENNVNVTYQDEPFWLIVSNLLLPISSIIMILLVLMLFMGGAQGQARGPMTFGKSRAKMLNNSMKNRVTFNDVAGIDEEKEELQEIVEF